MKKLSLALATFVFMFLALAVPSYAQYGCQGQYGQYGNCPPSQSILVDKFVGKVTLNKGGFTDIEYTDNMSASDTRFKANDMVAFMIKVKNTSGDTLTNVTVKDFIPSYVNPIEGPGTYDSTNRVISFNAGDFQANEEKVYYFKVQVVPTSAMPNDRGLFCQLNKAQAYNDNASDEDTAQFCIEKQVVGVTQVPQAGPEMGVLLLSLEAAALGAGLFIKKKIQG